MKNDSFNVEHIANLARLRLSGAQKRGLKTDLADILKFVSILDQVKAPPKSGYSQLLAVESVIKADINAGDIWEPDIAANLRGQAPQTKNNYLVVEPVISK